MSVFQEVKCEVCSEREPEKIFSKTGVFLKYKKRCSYCKDRFDSQGEPFIVYCDIYGMINKHRRQIYVWVMDARIVKLPMEFEVYKWGDADTIFGIIEDEGFIENSFSDAVFK